MDLKGFQKGDAINTPDFVIHTLLYFSNTRYIYNYPLNVYFDWLISCEGV